MAVVGRPLPRRPLLGEPAAARVRLERDGAALVNTAERFYEPGLEYEFYPRNSRSPFRDDLCTQTHALGEESDLGHDHGNETTSTTSGDHDRCGGRFGVVGQDRGLPR